MSSWLLCTEGCIPVLYWHGHGCESPRLGACEVRWHRAVRRVRRVRYLLTIHAVPTEVRELDCPWAVRALMKNPFPYERQYTQGSIRVSSECSGGIVSVPISLRTEFVNIDQVSVLPTSTTTHASRTRSAQATTITTSHSERLLDNRYTVQYEKHILRT